MMFSGLIKKKIVEITVNKATMSCLSRRLRTRLSATKIILAETLL